MPKVTPLPENTGDICPIIYALSIIGQKWKIPILWHLAEEGTLRYNELKRGVRGITNIMLTKSLQELEAHNLIHREKYDTTALRVEYSLTPRGQTLVPLLRELDSWGRSQLEHDRARGNDSAL